MKKIINIIEKASRIRNRFKSIVRGGRHNEHHHNHHNHHNHNHHIELDDHNDSSNWTYN